MRRVMIVAALVLAVASPVFADARPQAPAAAPTSRPDSPEVAAAREAVIAAQAACRSKLEATEDYRSLKTKADTAVAELRAARGGTDPRAKLDASSRYTRAVAAVRMAEVDAEAADADVGSAIASLSEARQAQTRAELEQARAAAEHEANDPVRQAIKAHRLVRGMTIADAKESLGSPVAVTDAGEIKSYVWRFEGDWWSAGFIAGVAQNVTHSR